MYALLKLLLVFVGIIILLSRKCDLSIVLLLASLVVGLFFGYPLRQIARDAAHAAVAPLTLRLALTVVLIMLLSELLRETAGLEEMVEALQALVPARLVIMALPSLIGLLPMVGGAMFSAPMVEEVGERLGVDPERKTFVNYWFRHVWEYVFPLYPSVILAAAMLGLTTLELIGATWPLTATAVISGALIGLWNVPQPTAKRSTRTPGENLRTLGSSIWPIALVVLLSLMLPLDESVRLIVSILITAALITATQRLPLANVWTILQKKIPWKTVTVIFSALIFRQILDNSGAVVAVSASLTRLNVPLALITFTVPFIAGLLTGLSSAAYSIGFPVVAPLLIESGGAVPLEWATWLMAGGLLGVMLSPMHLCLALTRVYFKAEWGPIYRQIASAALVVALTATLILVV
jgi:hypothetical protein